MKSIQCSCGQVVCAETAEQLLAEVEAHIDAAHGERRPKRGGRHEKHQVSGGAGATRATEPTRREES